MMMEQQQQQQSPHQSDPQQSASWLLFLKRLVLDDCIIDNSDNAVDAKKIRQRKGCDPLLLHLASRHLAEQLASERPEHYQRLMAKLAQRLDMPVDELKRQCKHACFCA